MVILNRGSVIAQGRVDELLSQAHGVEMRIADGERAARILTELDWVMEVRLDGDCLHIQAQPERTPELLASLAAYQMYPFEVRPVVSSLEEIFLDLTQDGGGL